METWKHYCPYGFTIIAVVLIVGIVFLYRELSDSRVTAAARESAQNMTIADRETTISARDTRIAELETILTETQELLQRTVDEKEDLSEDLEAEKDRNDEFQDQIEKIGSTVGTLDKLAKTDPELLMKYSKVYFLNEHYMPEKLKEIPTEFLYQENGDPEFIEAHVATHLNDMLRGALDDEIKLWVVSAFRSFDEQRALKGAYTVSYGSGANTFSADQGYSEHQLGTTVDLTTEGLGGGLSGFADTPAYTWLTENAYRYGFVLSYPKDNAYYIFEPWHWRFVGIDLARYLHKKNSFFYDLDQRVIDTYLVNIFD